MLFTPQNERFPKKYPWCQDFISAMWKGFWTPDEFDFKSDLQDFRVNISAAERGVIERSLSAISQIEVAVKRFWADLGKNLNHPEINDLGLVMAHVETIHGQAYEKLLHTLNLEDIFLLHLKQDVFQNRVLYLRKYNEINYENKQKQYIYSLILFSLFVENVSLFSQFYVILYFSRFRNLFKDTGQQIDYTKREEEIHFNIGAKLINTLREEYPNLFDDELEQLITEKAHEAYKSEYELAKWILNGYNDKNLNLELLDDYIKYKFNESFKAIGFKELYKLQYQDQYKWMEEEVKANNKTDFFHKRSTAYTKITVKPDDLF